MKSFLRIVVLLREAGATGLTIKVPFFEFSVAFQEDSDVGEVDESLSGAVSVGFRLDEEADEDEDE